MILEVRLTCVVNSVWGNLHKSLESSTFIILIFTFWIFGLARIRICDLNWTVKDSSHFKRGQIGSGTLIIPSLIMVGKKIWSIQVWLKSDQFQHQRSPRSNLQSAYLIKWRSTASNVSAANVPEIFVFSRLGYILQCYFFKHLCFPETF